MNRDGIPKKRDLTAEYDVARALHDAISEIQQELPTGYALLLNHGASQISVKETVALQKQVIRYNRLRKRYIEMIEQIAKVEMEDEDAGVL